MTLRCLLNPWRFKVIDEKVVVFVISVGKRERSEVYSEAVKRIL
ncbi:addiction module toxin RelE [Escherichia coli]|nr:addiction module toxin RelE [Escherichia coli]